MKLNVDIPERPEATFHLELTEQEASLVCILIRCLDKNHNPETDILYNIQEHLYEYLYDGEIYKNAVKRARPNGRIELGTVEGVDLDSYE